MQLIYMDRHRSKGSFIPNSLCNLYITLKVPVSVFIKIQHCNDTHMPGFCLYFFFFNLPCILREEGAAYGTRLEVVGVHSLPGHYVTLCECSGSWLPFTFSLTHIRRRRIFGCERRTWTDSARPYFWKDRKVHIAPQISASCIKRHAVSAVGARLLYLPDSVSKGFSVSESLLKSKGSASCSSSMQSLSVRFPGREYFASTAMSEIKSLVSNRY